MTPNKEGVEDKGVTPNKGGFDEKSGAAFFSWDEPALGLAVSQHGHLVSLSSFITSQVGHFHLFELSGALNPDEAQLGVEDSFCG